MNDPLCRVIFRIKEDDEAIAVEARPGENLLDVARRGHIPLFAPCDGNGTCGKCRVRVLEGGLRASRSFYVSDADYDEGWRLACLSRVDGDATLLIE